MKASRGFHNPDSIHVFKVNIGNIRRMCKICSKLTIKTPERLYTHENIRKLEVSHIVLVFTLLTFKRKMLTGNVSFRCLY